VDETRSLLAIGIAAAFWMLVLWWGVHMGCDAYYASPDIEPFGAFARPLTTRLHHGDSKVWFLFGPLVVAAAFGLVSVSLSTKWLDRRLGPRGVNERLPRIIAASVLTSFMAIVVAQHADDAVRETQRIGWHGSPARSGPVDTVCRIANI